MSVGSEGMVELNSLPLADFHDIYMTRSAMSHCRSGSVAVQVMDFDDPIRIGPQRDPSV